MKVAYIRAKLCPDDSKGKMLYKEPTFFSKY
jgi:hypothetical protein